MATSSGLLAGRLALVTGGGSGIGRAVCSIFAREGAILAVADRNKSGAEQTVSSLPDSSQHAAYEINVASATEVSKLLQDIESKYKQVPSVAVHAAGINKDNFLLKLDEQTFDDVINVNLKGTFLVNQALARAMVKSQVQDGSIVNISSIVGKDVAEPTSALVGCFGFTSHFMFNSLHCPPQLALDTLVDIVTSWSAADRTQLESNQNGNLGQANYAASKAGVIGFTKTAAKELARYKIRVNVILPGFIETPMTAGVPENVTQMIVDMIPLRRMGTPEEIAEVCAFLASARSSYITGAVIDVNGE